jgi:hypothetical protein
MTVGFIGEFWFLTQPKSKISRLRRGSHETFGNSARKFDVFEKIVPQICTYR